MHSDDFYMARCIQLAKLGKGYVAPNPMVGAVIVHNDKIIGEGVHETYGQAHAEVNAINSVKDKSILAESSIYVSLEPCSHMGKTPPCADLIVKHKFKRVVIGSVDNNALVSGEGVRKLKQAGIEVTVGILQNECQNLNKHFFHFHKTKQPYVLLKWAQTEDGFIDNSGNQASISCEESRAFVHQLRHEYQAILVGKNTAKNDNPSLTVRAIEGSNPIRIVLDSNLELEQQLTIFNQSSETIILNLIKNEERDNLKWIQLVDMSPVSILTALHKLDIQSVLIEGGAETIQSFIDQSCWDEAKVIIGSPKFQSGTIAPKLDKEPTSIEHFFTDRIKTYMNS